MATIKIRRGTKSQLDSITLAQSELGYTTDTDEVYVGDGTNHHLIGRVIVDTFANRPSAGVSGRMFHASDTDATYVDDGTTWVDVSSGIGDLDDIPDGTTYVRTRAAAVDSGYIVQLTDNSGANALTRTTIQSHIDDADKHREINDSASGTTDLWSASKIQDEIATVVSGIDPQESVLSQLNLVTSEPVSPTTGDRYINTATGTSSETSQSVTANYIYEWNGSTWDETVASEGMHTWVEDEDTAYVFNGTSWVKFGSTVTHNNLAGLNDGDYKHLTAAEKTNFDNNIHVAATVTDTASIDLTITGQEISGVVLPAGVDHDSLNNTHNLTTDIDHATITNGHNLTTDINHNTITNGHNLTTDIDHDQLTNFDQNEHFLQSAISITASQVSDFVTEARAAITVADTSSIDLTYTAGGEISADLLEADGGTFV